MKKWFFLLILLPASLWAQKNTATKSASDKSKVQLICHLYGLPAGVDSISLFELGGLGNRTIARGGRRMPDSAFVLVVPASKSRFYGVGVSEVAASKVILGEEPEVKLYAQVQYMELGRTSGSPINSAYEKVQKQIVQLREEAGLLRSRPADKTTDKSVTALRAQKTRLLDSLKTANPLLWRVAALQLFPDYASDIKGYVSPTEFYGKEFFRNADLADAGYEGIPAVFDAFSQYAQLLTNMRASKADFIQWTDAQLAKIPQTSKTYRMALGGLVTGLKTSNNTLYPEYARKYIDRYKNASNGEIAQMDMEMKRSGTSTPGFEAPDLVGMTPDSQSYALSKMRGKIVLIDFWASWCGPCRRENPNVVANYNKYKDKGFDILGVSLDREPNAWKKAIKDDGLPWHHISDLKGWQSSHAALYSVTSIPQTVLVDKDGKILARNVRGDQLGAKLKELLGE